MTCKRRIQESFSRSQATYDTEARVQAAVRSSLLHLLRPFATDGFARVLEIGCGTGGLSEEFCQRFSAERYEVNDLVPEFCGLAMSRIRNLAPVTATLPGDIEQVELEGVYDLVLSSSTFQWLADLPGCLKKCAKALTPGGTLAFAMFGVGTMLQFRELVGIGLHYPEQHVVVAWLEEDFELLVTESSHHRLYFPDGLAVLHHIKKTGVGGAGTFRWTPQRVKSFVADYRARFAEPQGLPLDYVAYLMVARKKGVT